MWAEIKKAGPPGSKFSPGRILEALANYDKLATDFVNSHRTNPNHATIMRPAIKSLLMCAIWFMKIPFVCMYYIYVAPQLYVATKVARYASLSLRVMSKRSSHVRRTLKHIKALLVVSQSIVEKIRTTQLSDLIVMCFTTIIEIIYALLWPPSDVSGGMKPSRPVDTTLSVDELTELLKYEELDCATAGDGSVEDTPMQFRRSLRAMHHQVPVNPFKATVRIHKTPMPSTSAASAALHRRTGGAATLIPTNNRVTVPGAGSSNTTAVVPVPDGAVAQQQQQHQQQLQLHQQQAAAQGSHGILMNYLDADSPASFPPTPFSRAYVMSRSSERVVSTMFAARDQLRLEALSVSRDEHSRMVAKVARTSGQYAIFDPRQTSNGLALTCGNHCLVKVGEGLCGSGRAMMPLQPNTYVYFEFSITVSSAQIPTLGLGLSPPDCPLNVMVGSWPRSVGLYTDGQILVGSRWYQGDAECRKIEAGSTVGMLVYLPTAPQQQQLPQQHQQQGQFQGDSFKSTGADVSEQVQASRPNAGLTTIACVTPEHNNNSSSNNKSSSSDIRSATTATATTAATTTAAASVLADGHHHSDILDDGSSDDISPRTMFHFTINGEPLHHSSQVLRHTMEDIVALQTPLYPTVSLFSEHTRVWCRFCEADVVYRSRRAIGAPAGKRVYCLDGSLLLEEAD